MEQELQTAKLAYSIREACEASSLGRTTIYKYIAAGQIKTRRIGRRTIIPAEALSTFLNRDES
jgi:excisionase family DNA binding protein